MLEGRIRAIVIISFVLVGDLIFWTKEYLSRFATESMTFVLRNIFLFWVHYSFCKTKNQLLLATLARQNEHMNKHIDITSIIIALHAVSKNPTSAAAIRWLRKQGLEPSVGDTMHLYIKIDDPNEVKIRTCVIDLFAGTCVQPVGELDGDMCIALDKIPLAPMGIKTKKKKNTTARKQINLN